jgi:hypothetical protein
MKEVAAIAATTFPCMVLTLKTFLNTKKDSPSLQFLQ